MTGQTFKRRTFLRASCAALGTNAFCHSAAYAQTAEPADSGALSLNVEQVTFGPKHHFFGYIGQSKTIPWNASGRYILSLRTDYHNRMPTADDAAEICLIDTRNNNKVIPIEETRAWNFQQGAMFYWNPASPDTQFFFNDRDPKTNHVYTVLYDVEKRERVREYRYPDTPVGNGGVAPDGKVFAAINYGRLARERPVTGYPGAYDWSAHEKAPANDGLFLVDSESGRKHLLISFEEMANGVRPENPGIDKAGLYINHTLWNRKSDTIYFFLRGRRWKKSMWVNMPCTIKADGTEFTTHNIFIGGHPEWAEGYQIVGRKDEHQILYDVNEKRIVGRLGSPEIFPKPEGDISLSPDGTWFVNGSSYEDGRLQYDFLRMADGAHVCSPALSRGTFLHGELRIDPAPRWNRDNNAILVPNWTEDGTRQLFVIRIQEEKQPEALYQVKGVQVR